MRLHDLGYVEGKNVVIECLVHMDVDLIFASSSTEVEAARQATRTIPIVFAVHADPVGVGYVASLPRPGVNITGLSDLLTDLVPKQLETLRRIGVLWNPSTPSHAVAVKAVSVIARSRRRHLHGRLSRVCSLRSK